MHGPQRIASGGFEANLAKEHLLPSCYACVHVSQPETVNVQTNCIDDLALWSGSLTLAFAALFTQGFAWAIPVLVPLKSLELPHMVDFCINFGSSKFCMHG